MRRGKRQQAKGEINNQFLITGFSINKREFLREMADHKFQIHADGFDSDIFYQRNLSS